MTQNIEYFSGLWHDIPWKKFQKKTYQLQNRIYKASRKNNIVKVISLQKRLFGTYEARMLAIRQVTQLNKGKKTAGIDGLSSLTMKQRFDLEKDLAINAKSWKHKGLRQISIPKPDSDTRRLLKIPTIRDRAWQCLVKLITEPAHEARFHSRSYGFRTGRSAHDAQKIIFSNLHSRSNGKSKRIIELDIEKCFDRIKHTTILNELIAPKFIKNSLSKCLKSGTSIYYPEQGTPQGGVISPLLANIALNGIEDIHPSVRYADDMIFFLKPNDDESLILAKIDSFLANRGMNISKKKTKITTTTSGFDFLGWQFIVQENGKFKCYPSKGNYTNLKKKIKTIVNNSTYGARTKSAKIAPIIRGWRNYHQYCDMSKHNLWSLNYSVWKKFYKEPKLSRKEALELIRKAFPKVSYSSNKFVNVKQDKSPFDGDLVYWSKRNSKLYGGLTSTILKKQSHTCKYCGLSFLGDQQVHLHHLDKNHKNWKYNNLVAIHHTCHILIHHKEKGAKREIYTLE